VHAHTQMCWRNLMTPSSVWNGREQQHIPLSVS